jgi:N-methylhydantoinase A
MIAFGGAAPLHAARLAAKLGIRRVLVPLDASVGSAVGFLQAPVSFEVARSFQCVEDFFEPSRINSLLEQMQNQARSIVSPGAMSARLATHRSVEMRYEGQGHEISVPLPDRRLSAKDAAGLRAQFEKRYERQFGLRVADVPVEFLTWAVSVSTPASKVVRLRKKITAERKSKAKVFDPVSGKRETVPVYQRGSAKRIAGPALIVEPQTTTLVPRGWRAKTMESGHILLEKIET